MTVNLSNSGFGGALALLIASGLAVLFSAKPPPPRAEKTRFISTNEAPLHFEPADAANAAFIARGPGYSLQVRPSGMSMHLRGGAGKSPATLGLQIAGANPKSVGQGLHRLPGTSNYYIGNNPEKWRRGVPHFARVRFDDVYPGIDVVYYDAARAGRSHLGRLLEYDFIVEPGADPDRIRLQFEGIDEVSIERDGALRLRTPAGDVRQYRPLVYQEIAEMRRPVGGRYVPWNDTGVRFELGPYDRTHPLVIDPKVEYSTYLGGSGDDQAFGIDVGPDGSVYVVGWTESVDFPARSSPALTASGNSPQQGHERDAFLTRFDNSLTTNLAQSFFGSNGNTQAFEVTVDRAGNAYITGFTDGRGFPETDGSRWAGGRDAFTAVVSPAGDLLYSGTLGGSGDESGTGIDFLRGEDTVSVLTGGSTNALNFPVTPDAFQKQRAGEFGRLP